MRRHTVIILLLFLFPSKARAQMGQLFPSLSFLMPPMSVTIHAEAIAPDMTFERRGWTEFRKSDTGERFRVSHPFGYETYPGANDFNFYRLANGSFIVADISQGIQMAYETRRRTGVFALEEPTSCLPYLRDYNAQYRHANE